MLAGLAGGDGQVGMGTVGGGDRNDVHTRVGEDALRIGGGVLGAVLRLLLLRGAFVDVAEAAHGYAVSGGGPAGMCAAGAAAADERPSQVRG